MNRAMRNILVTRASGFVGRHAEAVLAAWRGRVAQDAAA